MSNTELATQNVGIGMLDSQSYALTRSIAKDLAASDLVPQRYRNNPPNCMIALNMSARIGADPMMVMQNLYVVHGTPGWSSQFLIATFNHNPKFSALRYEFDGKEGTDEWKCRAWAIEKETDEKLYGSWVSIDLAKKEGWYGKNGSKWQTMPEQMLMYRAASWFIRAYAPEIAMGLQTAEEVSDTIDMRATENGTFEAQPTTETLDDKIMDVDPEPQPEPHQDQPHEETPQAEPAQSADPEQTQSAPSQAAPPASTDEIGIAESVLDVDALDAYKAANAAEKKKIVSKSVKAFGAQLADMERLVGVSYAQWTTKHRAVLLDAFGKLQMGVDIAEVFPTQ